MHRKPYQLLAMGGTFDHLHAGHQHFIKFATNLSEKVIIGVTNQALSQQKQFASSIEPYFIRKRHLLHYCQLERLRVEIVELNDAYGPTIDPAMPIQALAVTEYTQQGARAINQLRQKLQLRDLPVHVCSLLKDNQGKVISSTRIRSGEINRQGMLWLPEIKEPLILTPTQRQFFSHRQGEIIDLNTFTPPAKSILVGDQTTSTFIEHSWPFQLAIFDNRNQRQPITPIVREENVQVTISNPPGAITPELVSGVPQALTNQTKFMKVEGEEDLATVVAVLALPLGAHLFYGQNKEGIVHLEITEALKKKFNDHLFHEIR